MNIGRGLAALVAAGTFVEPPVDDAGTYEVSHPYCNPDATPSAPEKAECWDQRVHVGMLTGDYRGTADFNP